MTSEQPSPIAIRSATPADALAIATLHLRSWQWAYRGQVPESYLASLTALIPERERRWQEILSRPPSQERNWLAWRADSLRGFASTGACRDPDSSSQLGEVYAIYLDPEAVGQGTGRALFDHAVTDLRTRGFPIATLWVLETNARARRFYEAAGWRADGGFKIEQRPGLELREVRYRRALNDDI